MSINFSRQFIGLFFVGLKKAWRFCSPDGLGYASDPLPLTPRSSALVQRPINPAYPSLFPPANRVYPKRRRLHGKRIRQRGSPWRLSQGRTWIGAPVIQHRQLRQGTRRAAGNEARPPQHPRQSSRPGLGLRGRRRSAERVISVRLEKPNAVGTNRATNVSPRARLASLMPSILGAARRHLLNLELRLPMYRLQATMRLLATVCWYRASMDLIRFSLAATWNHHITAPTRAWCHPGRLLSLVWPRFRVKSSIQRPD